LFDEKNQSQKVTRDTLKVFNVTLRWLLPVPISHRTWLGLLDFRLLHTLHLDASNEFFKFFVAVYCNPIHLVLVCKKKLEHLSIFGQNCFFYQNKKKCFFFSYKTIFWIFGNFLAKAFRYKKVRYLY
jgi:hypothetical protein